MSAHAKLNLDSKKGVVIPTGSVVEGSEDSYVFIIRNGIAKKRIVTTGLRNDHELRIKEGIEPGEFVAVTNIRALTDNMPVDILQ